MFKLQSRSTHSVQSFMPYGELYKYNEKLFLSQGKLAVLLISVGRKQDFDSLSPQVIEILENCFTDKEKSEYFSKKKKFEYLYGRILTKRSIKKLLMYSDFGYHLEHHIEILNNKPNKPDLHFITPENVPKINFSISHTLNKVVIGDGPVVYVDPLLPRTTQIFIPLAKHFRYTYQEEYRFYWVPSQFHKKLEYIDIQIGSIREIAELIVL